MTQRVKQLAITERLVKMKKIVAVVIIMFYFFDNNFEGRK